MNFLLPLAAQIGMQVLINRVSPGIFPEEEDSYVGHRTRKKIRDVWEKFLDNNPSQRLFRVMLPDNLGLALGIVAVYTSPSLAKLPLAAVMTFTTAIALHAFREAAFSVIGPSLCRALPPTLGDPARQLFYRLGPSDFGVL